MPGAFSLCAVATSTDRVPGSAALARRCCSQLATRSARSRRRTRTTRLPRRAAEVVGEGQLAPARHADDLPLGGLAPELKPALEEYAEAGGADGMAERFEPAVGVDRQLALEVVGAGEHFLPGAAARGEAEVFHQGC